MTSHTTSMSRRSRMHLVGAVAASALLLTGCNSGGTPGGTDSASPAASATVSPSATPTPTPASDLGPALYVTEPRLPAGAGEHSREGLESFTRYYVELLEYAYKTGELHRLKSVVAPDCATCSGPIGDIENAYASGGWVVGGDLETTGVSTSFLPSTTGAYFVNLSIKQGRTAYFSGPGIMVADVPAPSQDAPMQLTAEYVSGAWQVESFAPPQGLQ